MKRFNYVYLIINKNDGRGYIGSHETNNINDNYFGGGTYIKNAVKRHGRNNFLKLVINYFSDIETAILNEEYYINLFDTLYPNGYNMCSTGGFNSFVNGKHNLESRKKISQSHIGKKRVFSEEHKQRLSKAAKNWHKNVGFSKETIEKIRIGNIGKTYSEATIENYKKGNSKKNIGVKHSEESIQQMSKKLKGRIPWNKNKKGCYSEESRKKMSISAQNRKHE